MNFLHLLACSLANLHNHSPSKALFNNFNHLIPKLPSCVFWGTMLVFPFYNILLFTLSKKIIFSYLPILKIKIKKFPNHHTFYPYKQFLISLDAFSFLLGDYPTKSLFEIFSNLILTLLGIGIRDMK